MEGRPNGRPDWMTEKGGLWQVVPILPSDYTDYGGEVERWSDPEKAYPDCSTCRWFVSLDTDCRPPAPISADWGVCTNPASPRAGLLTWEHQHGEGCGYESEGDEP